VLLKPLSDNAAEGWDACHDIRGINGVR
jgi:hypothetical protein